MKIGRRDALGRVAIGVAAAVALSIAIGVVVTLTIEELPELIQATAEAIAALTAVAVLTWMLFWMRRQGRAMKGELERGVDLAITGGRRAGARDARVRGRDPGGCGDGPVPRPHSVVQRHGAGDAARRAPGLAVAVGFGWAIFVAGRRINLRRFFTVTGTILIFVAGGPRGICGP